MAAAPPRSPPDAQVRRASLVGNGVEVPLEQGVTVVYRCCGRAASPNPITLLDALLQDPHKRPLFSCCSCCCCCCCTPHTPSSSPSRWQTGNSAHEALEMVWVIQAARRDVKVLIVGARFRQVMMGLMQTLNARLRCAKMQPEVRALARMAAVAASPS